MMGGRSRASRSGTDKNSSTPKASFGQLMPYLLEHKKVLSFVIVLSVIGAAASLAQPLLVGQVINRVSAGELMGNLVWLLISLVVATALKLEAARYRNASSLIPAGVLQVTGGEPLSAQELADLASAFNTARATNQTAALSENLKYIETNATPDKMLLIDAANYQALECSRLTNVPSYLLGIAVGGYSYVSNQGARLDLWTFGAKAIAECIQNTLSMDNVLPRGTYVRFDSDDYLSAEYQQDLSEMTPTDMTITDMEVAND